MKFRVNTVEKYGKRVKQHPEMDELRRTQCLCLNCLDIQDCPVAEKLYGLCKEHNIALAVTRCPAFNINPNSA